ncbi:MAG: fasciclin domain-containing protein [Prevotella sp.]|nr:fasciclin domain-containing protein [Prevotella sp.]
MKRNRIYAKIAGVAMAALAIVGCSDTWNDHYEAGLADGAVNSSLWEVIEDNSQLSNFARVLKATGYDKSLASSQVFTVFAPTNDALTSEQADAIIELYEQEKANQVAMQQRTGVTPKERDNRAIKEFVQNHIALYNHSVAKSGADSVMMMNGKYLLLTPEKLADSPLLTTNLLTQNGLLFTVGSQVDYQGNVFEALQLNSELDSVGNFMAVFNEYEFVPGSSVAGGIEDGKTWYLDSVTVLTNDMFQYVDYINSEDSVFWMVAPTNEVWNQLVDEYIPYFNYDNEVQKRDSLCWVEPRLAVIQGTTFSQTRNAKLVGDEYVWNTDSAMSVNAANYSSRRYSWGRNDMKYYQYDKPFAEGGAYTGAFEIPCSNGKVIVADQWNIDKTMTFYRERLVEAESRSNLDEVDETSTNPLSYASVESWSPFYNQVSQHLYTNVVPKNYNSGVTFKLPGLLSNIGYDIYVVFVPITAIDSTATDFRPTRFQAALSYHEQDGKQSEFLFQPDNKTYDEIGRRYVHNFENDPMIVDSVLVASNYKFPTCSYGLRDSQVLLQLKTDIRSSERDSYTGAMRIDCILIKPHDETVTMDE